MGRAGCFKYTLSAFHMQLKYVQVGILWVQAATKYGLQEEHLVQQSLMMMPNYYCMVEFALVEQMKDKN